MIPCPGVEGAPPGGKHRMSCLGVGGPPGETSPTGVHGLQSLEQCLLERPGRADLGSSRDLHGSRGLLSPHGPADKGMMFLGGNRAETWPSTLRQEQESQSLGRKFSPQHLPPPTPSVGDLPTSRHVSRPGTQPQTRLCPLCPFPSLLPCQLPGGADQGQVLVASDPGPAQSESH